MIRGELIGKRARARYAGKLFEGVIVDETKNTLSLEAAGRRITIIKTNATIQVDGQIVDGKTIARRPEDRIKK